MVEWGGPRSRCDVCKLDGTNCAVGGVTALEPNKLFCVNAFWDKEVKVWVANSDQVPGLATEADTIDALAQKLKTLVHELLELNGQTPSKPVTFEFLTQRLPVE